MPLFIQRRRPLGAWSWVGLGCHQRAGGVCRHRKEGARQGGRQGNGAGGGGQEENEAGEGWTPGNFHVPLWEEGEMRLGAGKR